MDTGGMRGGVPHAGNAGLAVSPCALRASLRLPYPDLVSSCPPVPLPRPPVSPPSMPASRILSRAIARPPVPRVLKPVSPPPNTRNAIGR